ncbi:hypothetical protein C8J56DRAFT_1090435 [Mycena floridula]|nr:hypothetical protein C8J56DRAFT_1090435 [Mycena floridula]
MEVISPAHVLDYLATEPVRFFQGSAGTSSSCVAAFLFWGFKLRGCCFHTYHSPLPKPQSKQNADHRNLRRSPTSFPWRQCIESYCIRPSNHLIKALDITESQADLARYRVLTETILSVAEKHFKNHVSWSEYKKPQHDKFLVELVNTPGLGILSDSKQTERLESIALYMRTRLYADKKRNSSQAGPVLRERNAIPLTVLGKRKLTADGKEDEPQMHQNPDMVEQNQSPAALEDFDEQNVREFKASRRPRPNLAIILQFLESRRPNLSYLADDLMNIGFINAEFLYSVADWESHDIEAFLSEKLIDATPLEIRLLTNLFKDLAFAEET